MPRNKPLLAVCTAAMLSITATTLPTITYAQSVVGAIKAPGGDQTDVDQTDDDQYTIIIGKNAADIAANTSDIGTNTAGIASLNNQVSSLTTSVQANREVASDGIAIALASKAPTLPAGANQAITMGFGHYDGRTAFAGGFTARVAPRSQLYGTVGLGFNTGKVGLSTGYQFSW